MPSPKLTLRTVTPILLAAITTCVLLGACTSNRSTLDGVETRNMIELLMPQRIEIVEAFTAFESFDDDQMPDGIGLRLQAQDAYGDPVKIAGSVHIELYTYQPASGENKGNRLCEPWSVELVKQKDQRRYWNMVTGMYEIPLEFPEAILADLPAKAGGKFVLAVTYHTPLDGHMTDECILLAPTNLR